MNSILLIDDDEDDQFFFKAAVEAINPLLFCHTALNGKAALEKLKTSSILPDLVFLDLNMPGMNGFEVLLQFKQDQLLAKIPIGIFSTSNILRDKELTKESGAQFFLTKPNDFQVLRKKLEQILSADFSTGEYITIT